MFLGTPVMQVMQVLLPEYRRSGTGDAFLCAAAALAWSHDAFFSKPLKIARWSRFRHSKGDDEPKSTNRWFSAKKKRRSVILMFLHSFCLNVRTF